MTEYLLLYYAEEDFEDMREHIEAQGRLLYGLVHARYILTTRGLAKMVRVNPSPLLFHHLCPTSNELYRTFGLHFPAPALPPPTRLNLDFYSLRPPRGLSTGRYRTTQNNWRSIHHSKW